MEITVKDILAATEHTLLSQSATWGEIKEICDDGIKYGTASVCIPPSFTRQAVEYAERRVKICTVIGFPNGYNTTETKCFETYNAVKNGADEIDMVVNIGMVKEGRFDDVLAEINTIKKACGSRPLKVIVETCLLTEEEKVKMCEIVSTSGAEYIKTSTGFSTGGATLADVELFAANVSGGTKIKAAGGIASLEDAAAFLEAGAHRLGTSRIVKIVKQAEAEAAAVAEAEVVTEAEAVAEVEAEAEVATEVETVTEAETEAEVEAEAVAEVEAEAVAEVEAEAEVATEVETVTEAETEAEVN